MKLVTSNQLSYLSIIPVIIDGKIRKEIEGGGQSKELGVTEILSKCSANIFSRYNYFIDRDLS